MPAPPPCGQALRLQPTHLHVPVDFLHELLLVLLCHVDLLHVVPEVHVFEGGKLLHLQEVNALSASHMTEDESHDTIVFFALPVPYHWLPDPPGNPARSNTEQMLPRQRSHSRLSTINATIKVVYL